MTDPEEVLYSRGAQVRYRRILDLQKAAIHVVDRDLRLVFFNANAALWAEGLGYGLSEESLGEKLSTLFPFLNKKHLKEYETVFSEGKYLVTEETQNNGGAEVTSRTQKIPVVPITFFDNKKRFPFRFFSGSPGRLRTRVHKFYPTEELKEADKVSLRTEVRNVLLESLKAGHPG